VTDLGARLRGVTERLRGAVDVLYREMLKFGVVGAGAFVVDAGGFNLLVYGGGHGPLHHRPLTAKIISVSVSVVAAWLGNRYWTFRHRRRPQVSHELFLFAVVNGVGLLLAVACLGFSRYVLGQESPLADNISGTFIGTALGTLFRFWAYRRFVFSAAEITSADPVGPVDPADPAAPPAPAAEPR
jgi:putative flippase GtrA